MNISIEVSVKEAKIFLRRSGFRLISMKKLLEQNEWTPDEIGKVSKHILSHTFAYLSIDEVKFFDTASVVLENVKSRDYPGIHHVVVFCLYHVHGRGPELFSYGVTNVMKRLIHNLNQSIILDGDFSDYLPPKKKISKMIKEKE